MTIKIGKLSFEDEDILIPTLISLTQHKKFRSAWGYLQTNVDPEHIRVYDAGVVLQNLSNEYGDIGDLKDDCVLKRDLEMKVRQVIKLLM
jgi:hypothetical protein